MAVHFQMVNHTAANYAVEVLDDLRRLQHRIGDRVKMVRHEDVGVDGEAAGVSRFIEGFASNDFDGICTENRWAVFGYGSDIESGSVS